MSQARRTSGTNRWIADRHSASDAGAPRLPGLMGFAHAGLNRPSDSRSSSLPRLLACRSNLFSITPIPRNTSGSVARSASFVHSHAAPPTCAASNCAPRASTTQAARAFLLASATTARCKRPK